MNEYFTNSKNLKSENFICENIDSTYIHSDKGNYKDLNSKNIHGEKANIYLLNSEMVKTIDLNTNNIIIDSGTFKKLNGDDLTIKEMTETKT